MKLQTKVAISCLLSTAGALFHALAAEFGGEPAPESTTSEPPAKPKKEKKAAAPAAEEPAAPAETPAEEPVEQTEEEYQKLRAIIAGPVGNAQGEEVKKVIAKYATNDPKTLKGIAAKHFAAFEKDIAALSY